MSPGKYEHCTDGANDFELTICKCALEDLGTYSCELVDFVKVGESSSCSCKLTVKGP